MTLDTLSRTFHPDDYAHFPDELARLGHAKNIFAGCHRLDHEHRFWEYAICLASLGPRENVAGKRILDLGGGDSLLGGILYWGGAAVTVMDLSDHRERTEEMERRGASLANAGNPHGSLKFRQGSVGNVDSLMPTIGTLLYDAVFCVSVVEHGGGECLFRDALMSVKPGGTFVLTTDFHPSGQAQIGGHNLTYNAEMLNNWAASPGFTCPGGTYYPDRGNHIFGRYNFASLHLKRNG